MEIRSYRRVFDLERRIYRIDQVRLNPGGVPVRGIVYALVAIAATVICSRLPVIGMLLEPVPWFLRDLVVPAAVGSLLAVLRIDGRSFDRSLHALSRCALGPRRVSVRACGARDVASRWHPPALLMLPNGSEHRLRRLRFDGPGAAHVITRHRCEAQRARLPKRLRSGARVALVAPTRVEEGARGSVIILDRGARLRVR
jgi:hypothetical protein